MNLMITDLRLMHQMLQYVGWNSFVLSHMILSNESLNDIQVRIYSFEDNQVCVILEVVKVFISKMSNDTHLFLLGSKV
jgi:hypothetical protein